MTGEVYHLNNVSQFPGNYAQGRVGFAVGDASEDDLWLQNDGWRRDASESAGVG